ncbi:MAG: hypothetical protein RIR26_875 [Pseudomonadota bacterium]
MHPASELIDAGLTLSRGQNPSLRHSMPTSGWLFGLNGTHLGEDLRLYPGSNAIGSSARCDVVVTAPEVGRQHAMINVVSGESAIIQPGSTRRQLYLNGNRCSGPSPLCFGDTIQMGEQAFAFISLIPTAREEQIKITLLERVRDFNSLTLAWLIEIKGEREGRDFRLFHGENRIGSLAGAEVCLADSSIKQRQCVITRHVHNWTAVPHSVTDPLYVNGERTTGTGIQNGDLIGIEGYEFLFRSMTVDSLP